MSLGKGLVKVAKGFFDINKVLKGEISRYTTEECVTYFSVIDIMEKRVLKDRKKALRERLLDLVDATGKKDKKGHKVLDLGHIHAKVKKEVRAGKVTYYAKAAEAFVLRNKRKDPMVESLVRYEPTVDEAVLMNLFDRGVLSKVDFDTIVQVGKPTDVLKVTPPREILDLIEG